MAEAALPNGSAAALADDNPFGSIRYDEDMIEQKAEQDDVGPFSEQLATSHSGPIPEEAGSRETLSKRGARTKVAALKGRHGLTFSSPPQVPRARPPRKTDFTHTPDQIWHIAAENQRTVKRLMDISRRKIEWIGAQKSKVFVPKLTGTARRRREAQQRLEQANAWLQRRLQAIEPSAGSAYAPHSRHRSHRDFSPSSPANQAFKQGSPSKGGPHLSLDSQSGWGQGVLAYGMQQKGKDQALRLKRDSPVPGLDLRGLQASGASEVPEALVWELPQKAP